MREWARSIESLQTRGNTALLSARVFLVASLVWLSITQETVFFIGLLLLSLLVLTRLRKLASLLAAATIIFLYGWSAFVLAILGLCVVVLFSPSK